MSASYPDVERPSKRAIGTASFQLWLLLVAMGAGVGTLWLIHWPAQTSLALRAYVLLALLSSVATLALLPGAVFLVLQRVLGSARWLGWTQAFVGACFLAVLYTDTVIYRLLRYHVNGAVLNVFGTRGSEDAIHLGPRVWITAIVVVVGLTCMIRLVFSRALARAWRRERGGRGVPFLLRPAVLCTLVFLPILLVEKSVWAAAQIAADQEVLAACRDLPLRPRPRLARWFGRAADLPDAEILQPDARLAYPLEWPAVDPRGPRPNILMLVVDSWRRDVFTRENTPNLWAFAADARCFEDHLSGGNGTRFAVFSMLYGLHGPYWFPVLDARRPPVLLDVLRSLGYELRVLSSASMNFPEFRQTAWVGMEPESIDDEHGSRFSHECDVVVAHEFETWSEARRERGETRPYFCFLLLDSPHQPYYSPPGGPFQPAAEELDYLELAGATDPSLRERVFNRYRNALLHADRVAGEILASLQESGELDDTLVLVTGDHGEEFLECGYWGHTSNFSPQQTEVPFIIRGPGIEAGSERRPTSHLDVPATLLELLGADPGARALWCLGENLLDPPAERARVLSGWSDLGLVLGDEIYRIPFEPMAREIEVYDRGWSLLSDSLQRVRAHRSEIEALARECTHFLAAQP